MMRVVGGQVRPASEHGLVIKTSAEEEKRVQSGLILRPAGHMLVSERQK